MSSEAKAPKILTVIFADTFDSYVSVSFEGQSKPYKKRSVRIELTPEQQRLLQPRRVGVNGATPQYEEVFDAFFEPETDD